jgi:deoxyribonuclease (pyrimidine dimer)
MTRINVGILPEELPNKLLIAEHREIKRIPNVVKSGKFSLANQPKSFTLGTGHVKFLYSRLLYLRNRYEAIYGECLKRGFNVTNYTSAWDGVPEEFMGDYIPTHRDRSLILERIASKGFVLGVK